MYNKYGADQFGLTIFVVALVCSLIAAITRNGIFYVFQWALVVYGFFRMFSKNYVKRRIENDHYLAFVKVCQRTYKVCINNVKDRNYKYFLCPHCHQMVRIPRGRGKVTITCPNCHKEFDKKS